MPAAIRVVTRLQDQDDVNVTLGAGVDAYSLTYDNASGKFVLTSHVAATDPHTPYALLLGRTGGQTLIGGLGVADILKLQGTSGNGTAAEEAIQALVGNAGGTIALTILNNGNVGIGTTSPSVMLYIY